MRKISVGQMVKTTVVAIIEVIILQMSVGNMPNPVTNPQQQARDNM